MNENHHFLRETVVDINAAVVGTSKNRWVGIDEADATEEKAKQKMKENRFDILPINSGANIKSYFHTIERNNYGEIKKAEINHRDVIPLQTHTRCIEKFLY